VRWREIRPHLGFLFDLALRETGRAEDAEDVVQEVATSALRAKPEMPRAYLAGAVLLRARHLRRGETRRRAREAALVPPSPAPLPDRVALVRDEVERALESLAPDERRAVALRHLHDLDYDEIGAAVGISASAARQRVHRALSRLRERFGSDGEAALALLPLFVMPRSLAAKPLAGALLMKMTTKAAVAILALAAGAAVGAATTRAPSPAPVTKQRPALEAPPAEDPGQLRAELAKYPPLDDADLLVYADTSLRGKLAAIDGLPEEARAEALRRIGGRILESGRGVDEALQLLRDENDPRVLFWLKDVLRFFTYERFAIPEEVRASFAQVAVEGRPAERRRAALALAVGQRYQKATPEWESALVAVFEREPEPSVVVEAVRSIIFVWIDRAGERMLKAYDRMPPGPERRELAIEYRRHDVKFEDVVARYDAARDASERDDWACVIAYAMGEAGQADPKAAQETFLRVYAETPRPARRAWLARSWLDGGEKLARLVPLEADRELCALLERAGALTREEARALLKEYEHR
jgi:RNA polymerase sigma-70 factor (ECF subfamily)